MKRSLMKTIVVSALILSLVISLVGFSGASAQTQGTAESKSTISVSGNHKIKVSPDIAYISIGVQTFSKEPAAAQKENKTKMDKVFKKLEALKIKKEDIKTIDYNISPRYEWQNIEKKNPDGTITTKGESILIGYDVNNIIQVTIRNLDIVGNVIDMTVDEGINKANSIYFGLSDEKKNEKYLEALKKAVENAKAKAQTMADVFGIKLGKPFSISESGSYMPEPVMYRGYSEKAMDSAAGAVEPTTPISAGEMEISSTVNVVYQY